MTKRETHKAKMDWKKQQRRAANGRPFVVHMPLSELSKIPSVFDHPRFANDPGYLKNSKLTKKWFRTDHSDFVSMDCVLCGKEMTSIHETHNPYPLSVEGRCCSTCNGKVISARLRMVKEAA
jgi:hypothetical protein